MEVGELVCACTCARDICVGVGKRVFFSLLFFSPRATGDLKRDRSRGEFLESTRREGYEDSENEFAARSQSLLFDDDTEARRSYQSSDSS